MYLIVLRSPGRNRTSAHWNQNPAAIANAAQGTTQTALERQESNLRGADSESAWDASNPLSNVSDANTDDCRS